MSNYDELTWTKSPFTDGVLCAEVASTGDKVLFRDDKDPDQVVTMTPESWQAFLAGAKNGAFDHI